MLNTLNLVKGKALLIGAAAMLTSMAMPVAAEEFPDRPINMVVGFGTGGGADRTARAMSNFLSEEIGVPVQVTNRPGAGTQVSANYVLNAPDDGYTIYASTFAPYLTNTVLVGGASYNVEDFSYINLQNFDKDLIVANSDSGYSDLASLLSEMKDNPGSVRGAVVQGSAGHLVTKVLMDEYEIPEDAINLVTYSSGGEARTAVAGGQVDFLVIAARGTESIAEFITPLALVSDEREPEWDAPAINEALEPLGISVPVIQGAMRGIAVTAEVERQHPERFDALATAIKNVLARKDVQEYLDSNEIGGVWVGPERANELMRENYEIFDKYAHLLN
nr:tripartite tricarboxylate transporter substrate binding protein [Halomonas socia]